MSWAAFCQKAASSLTTVSDIGARGTAGGVEAHAHRKLASRIGMEEYLIICNRVRRVAGRCGEICRSVAKIAKTLRNDVMYIIDFGS